MNTPLNNNTYIRWVTQHYKPLLVVQLIALVVGTIISMPAFMPPQYKSYAVVYPYNFSPYSHETPTEQMLQFLTSVDIKNAVIKKFNLVKHYQIDTTDKSWYGALLENYDKNVVINSTEFEAVQVTVYDISPDTACKIVNAILDELNKKMLQVQKEKSMETASMIKKELDSKKRLCDSLSAVSKQLSTQYGLLDYGNQTREVANAYYRSLGTTKSNEAIINMKNMEEKGMELVTINQRLNAAVADYDECGVKYAEAMRDANKQITFSNVVAAPYPSDKKAYPVRWLVVFITCCAALLLSVVVLRALERFSQ